MIKTLAKSIRENKWPSIWAPILVVLRSIAGTIVPFLMGKMVDNGLMAKNIHYIITMGITLLLVTLFAMTCGMLSSWLAGNAAAGFARNLRQDLYYHIQTFSFADIDAISTSGLITRVTTDVNNLQNAYQRLMRIATRAPIVLLSSAIMAFVVSVRMALLFVLILPVLILGLYWIIRKAQPYFHQVFKRYDKLNQVVREDVRGIRVVKTYVRQQQEINKFNQATQNIYDVFTKAQRTMALNTPLMELVINGTILLLIWFGAKMIVAHTLELGQLISLFSYAISILSSLMMLSAIFNQLSMAQASAQRVVSVLNMHSKITSPAHALTTVADGRIAFNHVDFSYQNDPHNLQLHDINLHIKSGQVIGIIGATGAGKTSLVQLIPRLYDVTRGSVNVAGHDVKEYDLHTLRDKVAVVLQQSMLFAGTIKENLRWGNPQATDAELVEACQLAQVDDFVRSLPQGYDTMIEQNGTNVSGGQMQRLCIARALLKQPRILILDDTTSAVDTNIDAKIRHSFRTDMPDVTKIIISQRIASIADADQIVVLDHGQINGLGTHDELVQNNPIYRSIYLSQTKQEGDHHGN